MPKTVNTTAQVRLQALLKSARLDAHLTQEELAKRIGRPQSFVAKYERGERRLDVVEFLSVISALGSDPRDIIGQLINGALPDRV